MLRLVTHKNIPLQVVLLIVEVAFITFSNYKIAGSFYSLDVLFCIPVIQAASLGSIRAKRRSDSVMPTLVGTFCALAWSVAEVAVSWPLFPINAFLLNVFTRSVTFTIIGRVVSMLWKEREYSRKDGLTDLANRLEFVERFEIEQVRSARSGKSYSLLFIDIDQFKKLNDDYGHHVGDNALKVVADLLRKKSRASDTVARIGGDEFVLLYPETDAQASKVLVSKILLASERAFKDKGWSIALSIGHVTETGRNKSTDEILRSADEKMYLIKKAKQ
jgi:diguanylate cyclase (GGDEF)-like protein